jgi:hypothetical protein
MLFTNHIHLFTGEDINLPPIFMEGSMKPIIDKTKFGSITIDGEKFDYDILIRLDGKVEKRKKKLSKDVFGTSHTISLAEAEYVYENGAEGIIIGSGQSGMVKLSDEAAEFFKQKKCLVSLHPTPEAIEFWNNTRGYNIGLFHITC